jgi:hypothetical protein
METMSGEVEPGPNARLRCASCGQVIGVYEYLMHVTGDTARQTSRAAEPSLRSAPGACYHLACHDLGGSDRVTCG